MVISKLIHLAAACHRLQNYATLAQIVMGLQSNHISPLKKTWEGLSSQDLKLWQDLQDLMDPRKNYTKMRNEMDKAILESPRKGRGCIPFIGICLLIHSNKKVFSCPISSIFPHDPCYRVK
jgi:hypothetical protein